jgi:hypothetical protein
VNTSGSTPPPDARSLNAIRYALCAGLAVFIHGYHPFAGDAGLYVAGIRQILSPSLYPINATIVTAFTRHSIFASLFAAFIHLAHLPLAWTLLIAHLASLWLFLCAARSLAARLFAADSAHTFAVLLAAACCALPVAGTALVLMDPYVTARSFSTPLSLFAIAACLDRAWLRTTFLLICAVLFHPLMGGYAVGFAVILALIQSGRSRAAVLLCCAAGVAADAACELTRALPFSGAYQEAISLAPRSFLFLARWRWYEVLGLVLPLVLFGAATRKFPASTATGALCRTSLVVGITSVLIAAFFVSPSGPYPLVPVQILRSFHIIYLTGVVLCGGVLGLIAKTRRYVAAALLLAIAAVMFRVEGITWPGSNRIEFPGLAPANPYQEAFLWIRDHTPRGAVFAFNPHLVYRPGEDEQGFRAIAERDHLADDKDAGIAAVFPSLAARWAFQRNSQLFVDSMSDTERLTALTPLGATWLLLPPAAATNFPCPFRNRAVRVCQLARAPAPPKANGPGHLTQADDSPHAIP